MLLELRNGLVKLHVFSLLCFAFVSMYELSTTSSLIAVGLIAFVAMPIAVIALDLKLSRAAKLVNRAML